MEHTSLKTSRALKDVGYRRDHINYWYKPSKPDLTQTPFVSSLDYTHGGTIICPAYTFTELWEDLPRHIETKVRTFYLTIEKVREGTLAIYQCPVGCLAKRVPYESPVEAVAQLMLWLTREGRM